MRRWNPQQRGWPQTPDPGLPHPSAAPSWLHGLRLRRLARHSAAGPDAAGVGEAAHAGGGRGAPQEHRGLRNCVPERRSGEAADEEDGDRGGGQHAAGGPCPGAPPARPRGQGHVQEHPQDQAREQGVGGRREGRVAAPVRPPEEPGREREARPRARGRQAPARSRARLPNGQAQAAAGDHGGEGRRLSVRPERGAREQQQDEVENVQQGLHRMQPAPEPDRRRQRGEARQREREPLGHLPAPGAEPDVEGPSEHRRLLLVRPQEGAARRRDHEAPGLEVLQGALQVPGEPLAPAEPLRSADEPALALAEEAAAVGALEAKDHERPRVAHHPHRGATHAEARPGPTQEPRAAIGAQGHGDPGGLQAQAHDVALLRQGPQSGLPERRDLVHKRGVLLCAEGSRLPLNDEALPAPLLPCAAPVSRVLAVLAQDAVAADTPARMPQEPLHAGQDDARRVGQQRVRVHTQHGLGPRRAVAHAPDGLVRAPPQEPV
mmetsp:Transcript_56212/g.176520  ORF Transcript_56212/g.176520 Transcript_56212/m.176520 type:complete len:491 (-) Transcript_56212:361-1833(-)